MFLAGSEAGEREIRRIKKQHQPLARIIRELALFDVVILVELKFEVVYALSDAYRSLLLRCWILLPAENRPAKSCAPAGGDFTRFLVGPVAAVSLPQLFRRDAAGEESKPPKNG